MRELVDFISGYDPLYRTVARGFPPEEIASLEAALGRRLPGAYRDFLSEVGANPGFDTGDVSFDIAQIIDVASNRPLPEHLIPIAEDEGPTFWDYYLDLSCPSGDEDALVVRISAGGQLSDRTPIFWSLRDMVFNWAFSSVRMLTLPEHVKLRWLPGDGEHTRAPPGLDALKTVMIRLGFQALTVTSPEAQLYERGDCTGFIYRTPYETSFSLTLAARDHATMLHVAEAVRDALPTKTA